MTRIADWFPAFPPAPTSMVRKSVMVDVLSDKVGVTQWWTTPSSTGGRGGRGAIVRASKPPQPPWHRRRRGFPSRRGRGRGLPRGCRGAGRRWRGSPLDGTTGRAASVVSFPAVSAASRATRAAASVCVATTELSAEGGVALRGARGAAGRTLDPTRLRLKEAEREVPLHPGGGVTPALWEDEAASSDARSRSRRSRVTSRLSTSASASAAGVDHAGLASPSVIQQPREGGAIRIVGGEGARGVARRARASAPFAETRELS